VSAVSSGYVLDASALVAFFRNEPGAETVGRALANAVISTVNFSEVCARMLEQTMTMELFNFTIGRLPLTIVPYEESAARIAASLKLPSRPYGLSHADRACLALGLEKQWPVLTGDRRLAEAPLGIDVELFR
jgi:ribonuclease VapC